MCVYGQCMYVHVCVCLHAFPSSSFSPSSALVVGVAVKLLLRQGTPPQTLTPTTVTTRTVDGNTASSLSSPSSSSPSSSCTTHTHTTQQKPERITKTIIQTCMSGLAFDLMQAFRSVRAHAYVYVYMHVYIYLYIYVCVCVQPGGGAHST
jgi:hypothetical protein